MTINNPGDARAVEKVPERPLEEDPEKLKAEEAIDSYTMRTYSSPAWLLIHVSLNLNVDTLYMSKVACLNKNTFQKDLQKGDLY